MSHVLVAVRSRSPSIDAPGIGVRVLAAYAFVVPLGSAADSPVSLPMIPSTLSSALGVVVLATVLIELVIWPELRAPMPAAARLWLALLGYAALSHAWSINRSATGEGVITLASLVAMTVVVSARHFARRDVKVLETALIASAAVTGAIAVYQWWFDALPESGTAINRFALVGDDPNHTAAALMLPAAAALVVALDGGERYARRLAATGAFALAGVAVLLTASRGGLIALVGLVLILLGRRVGAKRALAIALPAVALLIALPLPTDERAAGATGRDAIWTIGVVSCPDVCWFGSGLDTFPDVHERTAIARPELAVLELRFESHNLWLGTLVELGILGVGMVALITAFAFTFCLQSTRRLGDAALAGLVAVLLANLFIMSLEFKYFWLVILVATVITGGSRLDSPRAIGSVT